MHHMIKFLHFPAAKFLLIRMSFASKPDPICSVTAHMVYFKRLNHADWPSKYAGNVDIVTRHGRGVNGLNN